ncbi:hypothetical protein GGX14DRAFT_540699 [Mycena pura]|uniref:ferric-chelate reductase (NADPH) n=1 Tax=Mycena pura TaxID=153505 RepID=A0AAD6VRD7_9AGAR|nr:hypothetical protein GGX14DRAFT_540699 [Mycena pura]
MPSAAGGGPTGAVPEFDVGALVYHAVITLLALVALVFLARIPRALARLWRVSEWMRGHRLGYAPYMGPFTPGASLTRAGAPQALPFDDGYGYSKNEGSSDFSHTYDLRFAAAGTHAAARGPDAYPPHLEPAPKFLRPVVSLFRARIAPGFSAAQFSVCAVWFGVLFYAATYRSPGPFTDYNRFGYIAVSQVPFIFALGSKNNLLGIFLGMGYEKLNFLHRFVARLAILAAHIHGLGYARLINAKSFTETIKHPNNIFGLCMLLSFDGLLLLSTAYVRKNAYNLFFYSHVLFLHTLAITMYWHNTPKTLPYFCCTVAIYALDKLLRIAKTRISTATLRPIPELGATRVEIPYINTGWRAGQHVRIQVLSSAMGVAGWAEVHPFTIASASSGADGLVLLCKKTGSWTQKLFTAAAAAQRSEMGVARNVRVVVEGPYGGPGFAMFNSFSVALFVAGGSGITFALSAIQELIQQDLRGESRVRVIELIWVVQDAAALTPLIPQLTALIQQSAYAHLTVSVHYTKAVPGSLRKPSLSNAHPGLSLNAARPRLINAIESTISRATSTSGQRCGMIVGVCGPVSLADDVSNCVGLVDPAMRDGIGGIEIHEDLCHLERLPAKAAKQPEESPDETFESVPLQATVKEQRLHNIVGCVASMSTDCCSWMYIFKAFSKSDKYVLIVGSLVRYRARDEEILSTPPNPFNLRGDHNLARAHFRVVARVDMSSKFT